MISFLVPTRGRPKELTRFIDSVLNTARYPDLIEFVVRIDDDDHSYDHLTFPHGVKVITGPRKNLSQCYEWEQATGPIYGMAGDDLLFHTKDWDFKVIEAFDAVPDKILLAFGDDGDPTHWNYGTHSFIHRNWITAVGRYLPHYFSGDFVDTWLNDLAQGVNRKKHISIYTEHLHPAFGKREQDQTDKDRWEKHFRDDMPKVYQDTFAERFEEVNKLQKFIDNFK